MATPVAEFRTLLLCCFYSLISTMSPKGSPGLDLICLLLLHFCWAGILGKTSTIPSPWPYPSLLEFILQNFLQNLLEGNTQKTQVHFLSGISRSTSLVHNILYTHLSVYLFIHPSIHPHTCTIYTIHTHIHSPYTNTLYIKTFI